MQRSWNFFKESCESDNRNSSFHVVKYRKVDYMC